MAGATNKSAKRLGYTKGQIQAERAKGGVLSHAALMANGAPAKPTKAYKALAADMAERKKGLTRKAEPPAGWKAAARGEGKAGRDAATAARAAFVAKRDSAKGGNLDLRKQTERRYELTERLRAKTDDLREARRAAMNSGDDARVAKLDSQIKRMTARADRADEGWSRMGSALLSAPAEKRQQWEAKADRAEKRKALIARTAQNIGGVSKIARSMRQKQAADAQSVRAKADVTAAAAAKQAQIGRTARALGDASKIARATRQANAERIRKDAPARAAHEAAVTAERQKAMKTFMGSAKKVDRMIAETAKGDDNGAQVRRMIASLENRSGRPEIRGNSATYSEISRLKKSLVAAEDAGRKARDGQRSETAAARRAAQGFAPMRELLGR